MKTGWTVALVIAASLSAQTAVAGDEAQGVQDIPVLFRLLTTARLVSPDCAFGDALALHTCTSGIAGHAQHCVSELQLCADTPIAAASSRVADSPPAAILLRFDIEVRGP